MKPRLERAPLTNEDMKIRCAVAWRLHPHITIDETGKYRRGLVASDRRDADLMRAMREFGFRRWDMIADRAVFCLPDTLEGWWYWDASGRILESRRIGYPT